MENKKKIGIAVASMVVITAIVIGIKHLPKYLESERPGGIEVGAGTGETVKYTVEKLSEAPEVETSDTKLAEADAVILTNNFSKLPKSLSHHPLIGDFFQKDVLLRYEDSETVLGLAGMVRRLAFEHNLSLDEKIVSYLLAAPAEIALWKSYDGRLGEFLISLEHSSLLKAIKTIALGIGYDQQLALIGRKKFDNGDVPVFEVSYGYGRVAYFTATPKKLFIYSDKGLRLPDSSWYKSMQSDHPLELSSLKNETLGEIFGVERGEKDNTIVFGMNYLTFGYQRFFPSLKAIRTDGKDNDWNLHALSKLPTKPDYSSVWKAMPHNASICVSLPMDPKAFSPFLEQLSPESKSDNDKLISSLSTSAGICWYPESKLYAPLIVLNTKKKPEPTFLRTLFEKGTGNFEAGILTEEQKEQLASLSEDDSDRPKPASYYPPLPVYKKEKGDAVIWYRDISSKYGIYASSKHKHSSVLRSKKYFTVALGATRQYIFFSSDQNLVENALAVINKNFSSVADSFSKDQLDKLLVVSPANLVKLVEGAIEDSLPLSQESVFRKSVSDFLKPALNSYSQRPNLAFMAPSRSESVSWQELTWSKF